MPTLEIVEDETLWVPNAGGQQAFMDDYHNRYCALAGGWFAGKTWAGARKLVDLHVYNAFDDKDQPTGVKSCAIAPTYQLAESINIPELRKAFDESGLSHKFVGDKTKYHFVLPDLGMKDRPSQIIIRTADTPSRITGWTVGSIWGDESARWPESEVDEAGNATNPEADAFLQATGRLRDPAARCLQFNLTFTHEGDATRMYRDFEEIPKRSHALYRAGSFENPYAADFVEDKRQQMSGDLLDQYIGGKAMSIRGNAMYGAFAATEPDGSPRNVDARIELDKNTPLQLACDFNISPGMHAIIGQHFKGLDLITSRYEIHAPRMDVRKMVSAFRSLLAKLGGWKWPGPLEVFGDASGASKWAGSGESCFDILRESLRQAEIPHVLKVLNSNPAVSDRVNTVNCALAGIDGKVRYKIHPSCTRLIEDLKRMKWGPDGQADKRDRERSHAIDGDGYRVWYLMPIRRGTSIGGVVGVAK